MSERRIQSEPTLVLDHDKILSASAKAEIERASQRMLAAEAANMEAITMQPCPACENCEYCSGQHMVTPERAAGFQTKKEEP